MKIAIMSDIHSNVKAAEKAYSDAKEQGCTKFVCLGDIVGYGPEPEKAIEWAQSHFDICVMGNHDAGLLGKLPLMWFSNTARNAICNHQKKVKDTHWLEKTAYPHVDETIGKTKIRYAHGSGLPADPFEYIDSMYVGKLELTFLKTDKIDLEFVGHTHIAIGYSMARSNGNMFMHEALTEDLKPCTIQLNSKSRYIINPGSVGYPRNQHVSVYCIFDTDANEIVYRTIPFDFQEYAADLEDAGITIPVWIDYLADKGYEVIESEDRNGK